jgi:hypothetical protein
MHLVQGTLVAATVAAVGVLGGFTAADADAVGAQSILTPISGQGSGHVIVAPTAADGLGSFNARVTVNIHDTTPSTDFSVMRAVDPVPDGVCTSTDFAQVASMHTSSGGAAAVEFERTGPLLQFDLLVRVVGADGTVLQTSCMTISAKGT